MTAEAGGPNTEAARILVVEDDPEIRELMLRYLEAAGYKVAAVPDGRGMDALMAKQPIDLVLLDLMLQHETGFDLCRRIRMTSDARIIMVTALSSVADRVVGLDLGADDYIGKPSNWRNSARGSEQFCGVAATPRTVCISPGGASNPSAGHCFPPAACG